MFDKTSRLNAAASFFHNALGIRFIPVGQSTTVPAGNKENATPPKTKQWNQQNHGLLQVESDSIYKSCTSIYPFLPFSLEFSGDVCFVYSLGASRLPWSSTLKASTLVEFLACSDVLYLYFSFDIHVYLHCLTQSSCIIQAFLINKSYWHILTSI